MSKVAAAVAGVALIGIGIATGGVGFGVFAAGGWAGFAANLGASLALSVLSQALAKKPKIGDFSREAVGTVERGVTFGEGVSESFIVGRFATGGHLAYHGSYDQAGGPPNDFYTRVYEVSGLPRVGLRRVAMAGEWLTLNDAGDAIGARVMNSKFWKDGTSHLYVDFYDGTQTTAIPWMLSRFGGAENPYTADMVGNGIAQVAVTYRFSREVWQGSKDPLFEIQGIPLYDPRKDTTAGGSGAHRWNDDSTWETTENPIVIAYNIARGITMPDGQIYGGTYSATTLPLSNWTAAMNVCDQTVDGRPQYRFGAEIKVAEDEPADVIEACLVACQGQIAEAGGVFRVHAGPPAVASLSFTDGDLSADDPAMFEPIKGLQARYNGITSTYLEPDKFWESASPAAKLNADWEVEDGNRRLVADLQLRGVFNRQQAAQIQEGMINDERRQRQHQIVLPPEALDLPVLGTAQWTSDENGYNSKLFEVVSVTHRTDSLFVGLTLRERDPTDYDWQAADEVPNVPTSAAISPAAARSMSDWSVAGIAVQDDNSVDRRPALLLGWDETQMIDLQTMQWQVRLAGTTTIVADGTAAIEGGQVVVTSGILPGAPYEARGKPIAETRTAWTSWLGATAPGASLKLIDFEQSVQDEIDKGQQALTLVTTDLDQTLEGAVGVDELLVGLGRNEIANALPAITGIEGWFYFDDLGGTTFSARSTDLDWSHPTEGVFHIFQGDTNSAEEGAASWRGLSDPDGTLALGIPVTPGEWVEFHARISAHRCEGYVQLRFVDANGNSVPADAFAKGNSVIDVLSSSTNARIWPLSGILTQVPAGSVYAQPRVIKKGTLSGTNSSVFFYRPMFADTKEGAEFSPFSAPANTYIGPQGIVTTVLRGDYVVAEVVRGKIASFGNLSTVGLSADNASIENASITSAKLADASINNAKLQNASITSAKIVNAEIDTLKIAGNAVTVSAFVEGSTLTFNFGATPTDVFIFASGSIAGSSGSIQLNSVVEATQDTPSGTGAFSLGIRRTLSGSNTVETLLVNNPFIIVMGLKR